MLWMSNHVSLYRILYWTIVHKKGIIAKWAVIHFFRQKNLFLCETALLYFLDLLDQWEFLYRENKIENIPRTSNWFCTIFESLNQKSSSVSFMNQNIKKIFKKIYRKAANGAKLIILHTWKRICWCVLHRQRVHQCKVHIRYIHTFI